jgi:DNA-binding transcriptional ArsR family regulator
MNVKIFKALGNSARLKIVQTLLVKEHNVTDLTSIIKKDQTTVSRHLLTLTNASIIKSKRNGRNIFYSIFDRQMKKWLFRALALQIKNNKPDALRSKIEDYIMKQEKHG